MSLSRLWRQRGLSDEDVGRFLAGVLGRARAQLNARTSLRRLDDPAPSGRPCAAPKNHQNCRCAGFCEGLHLRTCSDVLSLPSIVDSLQKGFDERGSGLHG
jgi:hypothetical protein